MGYRHFRVKVVELTQETAMVNADRASSGPFKQPYLDYMGNPFSKRRPNPAFDPTIINEQTGAFRRAWRKGVLTAHALGVDASVRNADPKADWLKDGTETMVKRDVAGRIEKETKQDLKLIDYEAQMLIQKYGPRGIESKS